MLKDIKEMYQTYSSQNEFIKKLISINYFYLFIVGLGDVFIYVMIYDITRDIKSLIIYNFIRVTGAILGFSANYFLLKFRYDIKKVYKHFVFMLFFSFLLLNFSSEETHMFYIFGLLYGSAIGLFWFSHHNYTFDNLEFKNRDFFSSTIALGNEIFTILVPLTAVFSFFVSEKILHTHTYSMLFFILLTVSGVMLFFVKTMKPLKPKYVNPAFAAKKLAKSSSGLDFYGYNIMRAVISSFTVIFLGYVGIEAVNTPINVGIIEFLTGVFSIFLVSKFSHPKYSRERVKFMFISIIITAAAYFVLVTSGLSAFGYVVFSLMLIIANPFLNTVRTIVDMHSIDTLMVHNSHTLGIFYREIVLYVGRLLTFLLSLLFLNLFGNDVTLISAVFGSTIVLASFMQYIFAKNLFLKGNPS